MDFDLGTSRVYTETKGKNQVCFRTYFALERQRLFIRKLHLCRETFFTNSLMDF